MPIAFVLAFVSFTSALSLRNADPALPLIAADLGVSIGEIALIVSAYTLPYSLMQIVLGPVGDAMEGASHPHLRLCGCHVYGFAPNYQLLMAGRIIAGGFAGGLIPVALALISDRVEYDKRQVAISHLIAAAVSGQIIGAVTSGILADSIGWRAVFLVATLTTAAGSVCAAIFLKIPHERVQPVSVSLALDRYRKVLQHPRAPAIYTLVSSNTYLSR